MCSGSSQRVTKYDVFGRVVERDVAPARYHRMANYLLFGRNVGLTGCYLHKQVPD